MSKHTVLTDGNGSDLIQVIGLGVYVPLNKYQQLEERNAELVAQVAGLNKANSKLLQVASHQGRFKLIDAALDCLQYAALLNTGSCENLDRVLADTLSIRNNIQDEVPAPCLRNRDIEKFKAGYISALITHTEEPTAWCEAQANERIKQGNI